MNEVRRGFNVGEVVSGRRELVEFTLSTYGYAAMRYLCVMIQNGKGVRKH